MEPDIQKRIDAIDWYHEFDFGSGLVAKSKTHDIEFHRRSWDFIRSTLDGIDFAGKSVLDIGCWDGYWSFYAEKRGAARVLAADDAEQNWAGDSGLRLARNLLQSSIETNTNLSIYNLASLQRKFDIILCLGVYYHLIDPFYAFAQIRHCCHENTIVVFEGDVASSAPPSTCIYSLSDLSRSRFQPSRGVLLGLLEAAYFAVEAVAVLRPLSQLPHNRESNGRKFRFRNSLGGHMRNFLRRVPSPRSMTDSTTKARLEIDRIILTCRPFQGVNLCFVYRPPFGLERYDTKWTILDKLVSPGRSVTRNDVLWCYRSLLDREPESEHVLLAHMISRNLSELVHRFVSSQEFQKAMPKSDELRSDFFDPLNMVTRDSS